MTTTTTTTTKAPTTAEAITAALATWDADRAMLTASAAYRHALTRSTIVAAAISAGPRGTAAAIAKALESERKAKGAPTYVSRLNVIGRVVLTHPTVDVVELATLVNSVDKVKGITRDELADVMIAAKGDVLAAGRRFINKAKAAAAAAKVETPKVEGDDEQGDESNDESANDKDAAKVPTIDDHLAAAAGPFAAALKMCQTREDYAAVLRWIENRAKMTVEVAKRKGVSTIGEAKPKAA